MPSGAQLFAAMVAWAQTHGDRTDVTVRLRGPSNKYPKNCATVQIETGSALGQVTVWDTGECETDLGSTWDPDRTLIRSREVSTAEEVAAVLDYALDFALQLPPA
jgi:hypothetical protein